METIVAVGILAVIVTFGLGFVAGRWSPSRREWELDSPPGKLVLIRSRNRDEHVDAGVG